MQLALLLTRFCLSQNAGEGFLAGKPLMKFQFTVMSKSSYQCKMKLVSFHKPGF